MPFAITVDENNNQEFMISSINVKYSKKGTTHSSDQKSQKNFLFNLGKVFHPEKVSKFSTPSTLLPN